MPFVPTDIASAQYGYAADSLSLSDGTGVSTCPDSSTNGRTVTQVTGSAQPLFKTNILNGKPVFRFDGVDDYLERANAVLAGAPATFIAVASADVVTGTGRLFFDNGLLFGRNNAKLLFTTRFVQDYQSSADQFAVNTWAIWAYVFDSSFDCTFHKNGTSIETILGSADTGGNNNFRFGSSAGAEFWDGDIAEAWGFSTALNSTELGNMFSYLNDKYFYSEPFPAGYSKATVNTLLRM